MKKEEGLEASPGDHSASQVARQDPAQEGSDGSEATRAFLERHLGGALTLANLIPEVPASGVDRRQWLTIPEDRLQALFAKARGQDDLVYQTYLIRDLDVEIGSALTLPNRAPQDTPMRDERQQLLAGLQEGDLIRSHRTGSTFRVVLVTRDGIDIEMPGYDRPVSVSAASIAAYERVD